MRKIVLFFFLWLSYAPALEAQQSSWEEQNDYVNGYARVFHLNKFSFIDHKRQLIHDFSFEDARNFYHGLAAVKLNDKWGFINTSGKLVVEPQYDIVYDYRDKISAGYKDKKWYLLDEGGAVFMQPDITACYGFKNGQAIVSKGDAKGTIDRLGNIVFYEMATEPVQKKIPYQPNSILPNNCPDNLDFEFGNFTNWKCFTGRVDSVGNTNVITVTPSAPTPGRHTIYPRTVPSALDPFGLFPINPPDGSQFAVKLGNTGVGAQAERIQYTIHVPLNDSNFSFRYHYAVVLQDPGHTPWTQPRFTAKLLDSATNTYIDCASFEYISTSNLPGFLHSTVDTSVIYKTWSPVFISLRGYAGKTLYLEFTTADCVRRAHWGYAYVDVEDMCGQAIQVNYQCDSPHVTTLTGPPGFQFYNWWNTNFTVLLGTGQQITLNPGPPPNTLYWVEVIPYANFGCLDTLPVRITATSTASFSSTDTLGICAPHSFTFYNQNIPSVSANWDFGDGFTGTGDTVTHIFALPGTYVVTLVTSDASGCTGTAKDTVRVVQPSGSFNYTGGSFCNSRLVTFTATTNYIDSLIWDFGDGTILHTTATTVTHNYTTAGTFVVKLTLKSNGGCQVLLTGPTTITIEKIIPGFTYSPIQPCGSTTVNFTDTSHSLLGITSRAWYFDNVLAASTANTASHVYTLTGWHTVKLVLTGTTGCKDSIVQNIYVKVYQYPVAAISGINQVCVNNTISFAANITSEDTVNVINWSCTNGATGSGTPFNINFNTPGNYTVTLLVGTNHACYDTATYNVTVYPAPLGTLAGGTDVCVNSQPPRVLFTGSGGTRPYTFTYSINNGPLQTVTTVTGDTVSVEQPTIAPGVFVYRLLKIQDASPLGCSTVQNDVVVVTVNPQPAAAITGAAALCQFAPSPKITFTGSGGTRPYTFTYVINNGPANYISTITGDTVSIFAPTNVAGTFNYKLIRVQDASITACQKNLNDSVIITINPIPAAIISTNATVCMNSASPKITFTGSAGTRPYTFTYKIGNGAPQTITTVTGDTVSIFAPTNVAGTFIYHLIRVQDASSTACIKSLDDSVVIKVNPLPGASISSNAVLCQYAPAPRILFTGMGSTAPYTFTYTINNGTPQTITTITGDTISLAVSTQTPGTFSYRLLKVQDASSTACFSLLNAFVDIKINPAPAALLSNDKAVCINAPSPLVTFKGAGGTPVYTFTYTLNNGTPQTITSGPGDSVSIAVPTNVAGRFVYRLTGIQDASSTACFNAVTDSAVVTVEALPLVNAGPDKGICRGTPVQLNATGAVQYSWSPPTGLSCTSCPNPMANPADTTRYILTGSSAIGCTAYDTMYVMVVKPFPMFVSPGDTICPGQNIPLSANGADRYVWTPAAGLNHADIANPVASPASTTTYQVIGYDRFGCFSDTASIRVTVGTTPSVDAGPDLTLSTGETITLNPVSQNGPIISWLWQPATYLSCSNCEHPQLTAHDNRTYTVTVTNIYGCTATDLIAINTFCKSAQVFVPNAFTPDGDGLNDILMVRGKGIHVVYFRVFNRWGELVFEKKDFAPNDPNFGWDGKVRGVPATPDVFVYTVQVICDNNVLQTLKGNTTIIK